MLATTRLLTLLGMGGLGKTRLALQIGAGVMDAYPDGVWFVDLQTIRDPALVAERDGARARRARRGGPPLMQTLCAHLKSRKLLLILDNCEQIIDASAELVERDPARRAGCPHPDDEPRRRCAFPASKRIWCSRCRCRRSSGGFEALSESTAVQLFVERAKLHKPSFALTEREAPAIAELVARLEGIPLALELAAARVRSLSLAEINKRLQDRYKLLVSGDRTLQARQQTLRALVDWSYDLLQDNEQVLLARIARIRRRLRSRRGRSDLRRRSACRRRHPRPHHVARREIADQRGRGRRRCALSRARDDSRLRAREARAARSEQAAIAAAHCDYFFALAKAANQGLQGPEQAEWTRRVENELDNLRAAIALALAAASIRSSRSSSKSR